MSPIERTRRVVMLVPIEPAATGNGLAMRAELFRAAAAGSFGVCTVVVPVAGRGAAVASADVVTVAPDPARARAGIPALAADARWRERLARALPLPAPARAASAGLAESVLAAIDGSGPANLHVMRAYMAPLGVALAERLDARAMTLDLDEDDAAMARATGDTESAAAYERLLNVFAPCFDRVSAASAREAAALGERHGLRVDTVPNAVHLPGRIAHRHRADAYQDAPSLLFVGNLTYPPNVEAAQRLAGSILPAVCRLLGHRARATLVGAHDGRLDALQGEDVEVAGFVPDLGPLYANADVVVVPLTSGAGTRIKLLEAFAHGVPAVASHVAAAGLEVEDGCHLLLADDDEMLAELVVRLLRDSRLAAQITDEALRLVQARYSITAVRPAILEFLEGAHPRRGQPSVP